MNNRSAVTGLPQQSAGGAETFPQRPAKLGKTGGNAYIWGSEPR
jgi:hypothetical protein